MAEHKALSVFVFVCLAVVCAYSESVVRHGRAKQPKIYTGPRDFNEVAGNRKKRHTTDFSMKDAYKKLIGHGGSLIDKKAYDPDSVIAGILAGMFVKRNGIERSPHVDFQHSRRFRGQQLDTHRFTHRQKVQLGLESENSKDFKKRRKRNFMVTGNTWTNGIVPYQLDPNLSPDTRDVVNAGIEMMNNLTCVRFTPLGTPLANSVTHGNYVRIFNGNGCWSYVGMVYFGAQRLSLQDPGCISVATAVHEMCHALGMWHEQNRRDRDNYVELYGDNIRDGGINNINYRALDTLLLYPYDISSVLQYSLGAMAIDSSKPTMRSIDPKLAFLADKARGLMYYDAREITTVYSCTRSCNSPPQCENGGYVDQTCKCRCPSGLTGSTCSSVRSGCGGVISLSTNGEQTITSSNYPNNYNVGEECVWLVKAPSYRHIQMTIDFMDLSDNGFNACYHWLEVRYNLMGQDGPELCGLRKTERFYTTTDELKNVMILKFNTAISSDKPASKGFHLTVRSIGASCIDHPCKFGKCINTDTSYKCECDAGFAGTNCDQVNDESMNMYDNFDGHGLTFLQNVGGDTFDWTLNSDLTPSSSTGPRSAQSGKYYRYIETSLPRVQGDTAILSTKVVQFSNAQERCLRFYYHMFGTTIGSLSVYYSGTGITKTLAFTKSNDQGNEWIPAEISIPAVQNLKISFEGVRGSGYTGDIAIDSVELTSRNCSYAAVTEEPTTTTVDDTTTEDSNITTSNETTTTPSKQVSTPTTNPGIAVSLNGTMTCGFEIGASCFVENIDSKLVQTNNGPKVELQEDDFDWTVGHSGPTSSSNTGPNAAYKGFQYAFIEASSPRKTGERAILRTTGTFRETTQCLSFSYHMYGTLSGMGTLNVYSTGSNGVVNRIFTRTGNQGNSWKRVAMEIPPTSGLQIYFEGVCGSNYRSDIAIDDVTLSEGICGCAGEPCRHGGRCDSNATSGYKCVCVGPYGGNNCEFLVNSTTCTFENGICSFLSQSKDDGADWSVGMYTPSANTGPQAPLDGNFAYTEASFKNQGTTYVLSTAGTQLANQNWCVTFDYYMYGWTMGVLGVRSGSSGGALGYRWYAFGDKGTQWHSQAVSIPAAPRLVIEFLVSRGWGYRSDIAIDNVSLTPGSCS